MNRLRIAQNYHPVTARSAATRQSITAWQKDMDRHASLAMTAGRAPVHGPCAVCGAVNRQLAMYKIEMQEISRAFYPFWKAAGIHLSKLVEGGLQE